MVNGCCTKKTTNQPTNQPNKQTTKQTTIQPIIQPTSQTTNQPNNQPINYLIKQPKILSNNNQTTNQTNNNPHKQTNNQINKQALNQTTRQQLVACLLHNHSTLIQFAHGKQHNNSKYSQSIAVMGNSSTVQSKSTPCSLHLPFYWEITDHTKGVTSFCSIYTSICIYSFIYLNLLLLMQSAI